MDECCLHLFFSMGEEEQSNLLKAIELLKVEYVKEIADESDDLELIEEKDAELSDGGKVLHFHGSSSGVYEFFEKCEDDCIVLDGDLSVPDEKDLAKFESVFIHDVQVQLLGEENEEEDEEEDEDPRQDWSKGFTPAEFIPKDAVATASIIAPNPRKPNANALRMLEPVANVLALSKRCRAPFIARFSDRDESNVEFVLALNSEEARADFDRLSKRMKVDVSWHAKNYAADEDVANWLSPAKLITPPDLLLLIPLVQSMFKLFDKWDEETAK